MTEHGGRAGRTPNHLVHETSPYLLQHAYNPVEWHPWGDAALARAKAENKPILISIGYSACHWCHVMERECFEDPEIAALMNAHFVNIKVDREERPDLDHIYQLSAQMLGGGGGWPLNVFLTPDQRPFYAGTYFPPQDKYGRPGFPAVLTSLAKSFREQPERVAQIGAQITLALSELEGLQGGDGLPGGEVVERAIAELKAQFDDDWGGFGVAPKFPYAENLALFLTARERLGDEDAGQKALHTLRCMAEGGIYDQLGGGFHRYSTDDHWLVPHFEKMLYDNALLTPLYVEAYRITGDPFYADVVRATLAFVERELTHPDGAFYSTLDADSEGEEGRFYVWTPETVREALAADDAELALARYGVTRRGNFEMNTTVLSITASVDELALQFKSTPAEIRARLAAIRAKLLGARAVRVRPGRDEKVLVNWNGLMISAFAQAAVGLNEPAYAKAAARAADFIFARLWDGRTLQHSFLERSGPAVGFLDDYAFLAQGLLDLYRATWELPHLKRALELTELTLTRFWDERGGFFDTPADGEALIHRPKNPFDQATPSGNAIAIRNLLELAPVADGKPYLERAERALAAFTVQMEKNPLGSAALIGTLARALAPKVEVVIAGAPGEAKTGALTDAARQSGPGAALFVIRPGEGDGYELFVGKGLLAGEPAAYVCRNFTCTAPLVTVEALSSALTNA